MLRRPALSPPPPPRRPGRSEAARVASALFALLLLNAALSFSTWWPTPAIVPDARLAPEFVGLWLLLLALVAWRGVLSRRASALLALAYLLLVLGRYVDVTVPSLFGRPVNLFWDVPQIPRFLWVSAQAAPLWAGAGVVAVGALLAGLYLALRWAIAAAARDAVPYALRSRWALALSLLAALVAAANYAGARATWGFVSKPVLPVYWRQAHLLAAALLPGASARVLPERSAVDDALALPPAAALGGLRGRDLYLLFLESYGAVLYDDPRARPAMQQARARLAADAAAGGWQVVSAFVRSPTFAGASDLAHLGLLAGIDLSDPMRHDVLLTTRRPTLITLLKAAGYQTVGLYPAVSWEWPERAYYGFDLFIDGRDLGWPGPRLGYWAMPDPFALAKFERLHARDTPAPPRFVFFPTITMHLPFSPVPPQQPDWERLVGPQPFDVADLERALAESPNWADMFADYLRMADYTHRWIGDWLRQPVAREAVLLLVGDHQPAANITGEGVSWDVPVHVLARDPALLERFVAQGFRPGLEPPRAPLGEMHELTALLLRAFGDAPAAPAGVPGAAPPVRQP